MAVMGGPTDRKMSERRGPLPSGVCSSIRESSRGRSGACVGDSAKPFKGGAAIRPELFIRTNWIGHRQRDVRLSRPVTMSVAPLRICGRKLLKDGPVLRTRKVSDTATRGGTILSGWRGLPWWKLPQWPLSPQRPSRDLFTHPLTHLRSYWKTLQRFIFRDEPHFQIKWIF